MTWEAWYTAVLVLVMLGVLARGRYSTDIVVMFVLAALLVPGIVSPREAFAGFANTGLMTIAFLFVVAAAIQETGAMTLITAGVLGRPKSAVRAQSRLIPLVSGMSAFMNNTPIVAMFIPAMRDLARRTGIPAAKLMMPLSFAAILGGICTLIGTSTNLVVYSQIKAYNELNPAQQLPEFGMWTLTWIGVPVAIVGYIYMLIASPKLLPQGEPAAGGESPGARREYTTAMRAPAGSAGAAIVGKTIEQAGLRHLPGLFLSRIDRRGTSVVAVAPSTVIEADDVLVFVGDLGSVVDLQKIKGLVPIADDASLPDTHYRPQMRLVEVVISHASSLIGRSIREAQIRTRFGAVVIAVHRLGEQIEGKIGDIVVRPGDTLLLETDVGFMARHGHSTEFSLAGELQGAPTPRHERAWIALLILAVMVIGMSFEIPWLGKADEVVVVMVAAGAMLMLRCCTAAQARSALDWPVLIVIGASFGIGRAMQQSGLAATVAGEVVQWAGPLGPWALIGSIYLLTLMFTTLISNNAAAALMFPIALSVATTQGASVTPFAVAVAMAASLEFTTPLGYQTNLMVMRPGGYRFIDFVRFGGPLTIICAIVCIGLIPLIFPVF
jgi:di/tricarboxylate transporter